jgi:hypothetical protein
MTKIYNQTTMHKLAAYSAMAAAITASMADANAEVIYTDIDDVTIGIGDLYQLDMDADGASDFMFGGGSTMSSGGSTWSFVSAFGYVTSYFVGQPENQIIGYTGSFYNYGSALEEGALIGPDGPWLNYPSLSNSAVLASNFYGSTYGQFPGLGERYMGVKFSSKGNLHYGWIRVVADIDPVYATIMDFAYEANPNQPIEAGSLVSTVGVEELSEGVVNVYAFNSSVQVVVNRDLANAQVRITNLQGETVFTAPLNDRLVTINLQDLATGNYMVSVLSNEGSTTKQVFIN